MPPSPVQRKARLADEVLLYPTTTAPSLLTPVLIEEVPLEIVPEDHPRRSTKSHAHKILRLSAGRLTVQAGR